jgi:hypothetical protein
MDAVNGWFEIGGALVTVLSVRQLRRDRVLLGAHWGPTIFFTLWGCWNLLYYPSLAQPVSTIGAAALVGVNVVYLSLMLACRSRCPLCHDMPLGGRSPAQCFCDLHYRQYLATLQITPSYIRAHRRRQLAGPTHIVQSPMDGTVHLVAGDDG